MAFYRFVVLFVVACCFTLPLFAQSIPTGSGWRVGVIDSGIMEDHQSLMQPRNRIDDQACHTNHQDIPISPNGHRDFKIANTCRNDSGSDFTSSDAAIVPRKVEHSLLLADFEFGIPHGSIVSQIVTETAANADIIAINVSSFNSEIEYEDRIGNTFECDVHAYKNSKCYQESISTNQLNWVSSKPKVAAINISGSGAASCDRYGSTFNNIVKNKDIAVVVAAGNSGTAASILWPGCNSNTITVGALRGTIIADYTNLDGQIDFFADGDYRDYYDNTPIDGTSYAAPIVSAAFALIKEFNPNATVDEMKYALQYSASTTIPHSYGNVDARVPVVNKASAQRAAICLRDSVCLRPQAVPGSLGYFDGSGYGPAYGVTDSNYTFTIDFTQTVRTRNSTPFNGTQNLNAATLNTTFSDVRDVELTFKSKFRNNEPIGSSNGWIIKLNGEQVVDPVPFFYEGEQDFRFVINRNLFNPTSNTITIEPLYPNRDWGLKGIQAEFLEPIKLTVGALDRNSYGYDNSRDRYTGLRATFDLTSLKTDYALDVVGRDIDIVDETAVFLNEKFLGHLSQSSNNRDNAGDRFLLPKADLSVGQNVVEFVQRRPDSAWRGYQDERWLVKKLLVSPLSPNVKVTEFQVLDRTQRPNKPFKVQATVNNAGGSATRTLELNVYISNDETITTSDAKVSTQYLNGFVANTSVTKSFTIQSPLVNENRYIGICIRNKPLIHNGGGIGIGTHCSEGIQFKNAISVAPMIMLLLGDD